MRLSIISFLCIAGISFGVQETVSPLGLKRPEGLVISDGTVYVADSGAGRIWSRSRESAVFEPFVSDPRFRTPSGLTADDRAIYVADPGARDVFRIDKESKEVTALLPESSVVSPGDLIYLPTYEAQDGQVSRKNQLIILDRTAKKLYRLELGGSNGGLTSWDGGNFQEPTSLARSNYRLLVTDSGAGTIFESSGKTAWSDVLEKGFTLLSSYSPPGVFFPKLKEPRSTELAGEVYYVIDNNRVLAVAGSAVRVVPLAYRPAPIKEPQRLVVDSEKQRLLISDAGAGTVVTWPLLVPITVEVEAGADISTPLAAMYSYLWRLGVLPMVDLQVPYEYGQGKTCSTVSCLVEQGRSLLPKTNALMEQLLCDANQQYCSKQKLSRLRPGEKLSFPLVPYEKYLSVESRVLDGKSTVQSILDKWIPDLTLRAAATEEYLQSLNPGISPTLMYVNFKGLKLNLPIQRNRYYLSLPRTELVSANSSLAQIVRRYTDLSVRSLGVWSFDVGVRTAQENQPVQNAKELTKDYQTVLKNMDFRADQVDRYGIAADVPVLVAEIRAECHHPVFFRDKGVDRAFESIGCEEPRGRLDGIVIEWSENADTHGTCVSSILGARLAPYGETLARGTELRLSQTTNLDSTSVNEAYWSFKGPFVVNLSSGNNDVSAGPAWSHLLAGPLNKWVLFVAAAGNDDDLLANRNEYPAALAREYPNLISVGALDESGKYIWEHSVGTKREGSNTGVKVEILAPGESVPCAMEMIDDKAVYTKADGTSVATPLVSAVAALLLSKNLTPGQIKARILATAEPLEREKDGQPLSLFGKLSVERALLNPKTLHVTWLRKIGSETRTERTEGELSDARWELEYQLPGDALGRSQTVRAEDVLSIRWLGTDATGSYLYRLVRFDADNKRVDLNNKVHLIGCLPFTPRGAAQKHIIVFGQGAGCSLAASVPTDFWITQMVDFIGPGLVPDRFELEK